MSDDAVYRSFIDWCKLAWPMPEAAALLPMIKARYSVEDAAFLTGFPFQATGLDELAQLKGVAPAELGRKLDGLARVGIVFRSQRGSDVRYRLNDSFFTFLRSSYWSGDEGAPLPEVAKHTNQYYYNGFFDNWEGVHVRGLRTLPVNETIADKRLIMPFEDVVRVVEDLEYHSVSHCPCRQRKKVDPDSENCNHPTENCLHFGDLGRYCVDSGLGRKIEKEETLDILRMAAESGLVHGLSNMRQGADTICNCCKCCCMWFESYHVLGHHGSLSPSNYRIKADSEECLACGKCVDRCPMEAQSLHESPLAGNAEGKVSVVEREKCLGCGVCVISCPVDALTLERMDEKDTDAPPKDGAEFGQLFMRDSQANQERRQQEAKT